jgi:hypothetical protein
LSRAAATVACASPRPVSRSSTRWWRISRPDALAAALGLAQRSLAEAIQLGILDPKLDWSELGLQRIYENMQADGTIPAERKFELGKVTDAEYLRAAQGSPTGK